MINSKDKADIVLLCEEPKTLQEIENLSSLSRNEIQKFTNGTNLFYRVNNKRKIKSTDIAIEKAKSYLKEHKPKNWIQREYKWFIPVVLGFIYFILKLIVK